MNKLLTTAACAALVLALGSTAAFARDLPADPLAKERFQVRLRAIDVLPDEESSVNIGGEVKADYAIVPEVDLTYYFTKNIAAELIAATSPHDLKHSAAGDLGSAWVLPPTLTLQYHFMPDSAFKPYVGAGINYTMFYAEDADNGFYDLDVGNGFGWALQAGFDYWLNDHWGVNVDVKRIFVDVDATLNHGAVQANVDVDPWVIGAGVSYRF